jgi:(1->4)-alpha-D-glucan 1-alpha-D-glucosylmutase
VTRWQQFTGSIMAKGFEDTALYTYFPLASLNEVGGDPRLPHVDPAAFHKFIVERQVKWPHSMNATTTHDTKRSEDTRARIAVLSEIPEEWDAALRAWSSMNEKLLKTVDGSPAPDRNEEYLFYQTLIGAWPLGENDWKEFVSRVEEYMIKATREAKTHTRWTRPNQAHESALCEFVRGVLDRKANAEFVAHFETFEKRIAPYGMVNGLATVLLKVTAPGVPDCYQGSEWWDCRLVDPDNRGPVDFERRVKMLEQLIHGPQADCVCNVPDLLVNWRDARVKMHVLAQALNARRTSPDLFAIGEYRPLASSGEHASHVIAYARVHEGDWAVVVTPRCLASANAPVTDGNRQGFWQQTTIALPPNAPSAWFNLLTGKSGTAIAADRAQLSLGNVFEVFPVALLHPAQ